MARQSLFRDTMRIFIIGILLFCTREAGAQARYAVIVSANAEWAVVKAYYPHEKRSPSPWGEYFFRDIAGQRVLFFHEGWGKVAAAGATQYVIDNFKPKLLINLGTCGGIEGKVKVNDVILAEETIIYDIAEAMGDPREAIQDYTTAIDLSWLRDPLPVKVMRARLVSADKDLRADEIERLKNEYQAIAGDWESGAIAYTAKRNDVKLIILRGVSDLVHAQKGETDGNLNLFQERHKGDHVKTSG